MSKESPVRVLVVDGFKPWLSVVNTMLHDEVRMQVVGIAPEGPEAITQAGLLQPDMVLIDVTFPSLSGIDTARQIVRTVPKANIVFVNSNTGLEAVRTALALGALCCQIERRKNAAVCDENGCSRQAKN